MIRGSDELTELGHRFVEGLLARIRPWMSEPLPAEAAAAAELIRNCERSAWRFRNLRPQRAEVLALARARLAGAPPNTAEAVPVVEERSPEPWSLRKVGLARMRMTDSRGWRDRALAAIGTGWAARLSEADVMLMADELAPARAGFIARITADPDDIDAWSGHVDKSYPIPAQRLADRRRRRRMTPAVIRKQPVSRSSTRPGATARTACLAE
jgi:hypothetical protein